MTEKYHTDKETEYYAISQETIKRMYARTKQYGEDNLKIQALRKQLKKCLGDTYGAELLANLDAPTEKTISEQTPSMNTFFNWLTNNNIHHAKVIPVKRLLHQRLIKYRNQPDVIRAILNPFL